MKKYLTLFIFAFIATLSFGQSKYQDVIYAKDGSIIRGKIIKQVPNEFILIETPDGKNFIYQMYEIKNVTKEPYQQVENKSSHANTGLQSGFKEIVELAYHIDAGKYGINGKELDFISSYQINPYFSLGVGMGLRYYPDVLTTLVPVFGDFRVYFIDNNFSPYLSLGVGLSYNVSENWEKVGGVFCSTVGVSFKVAEEFAVNAGVGFSLQNINSYFGSYSSDADVIKLNFGFSF